MALLAIAMLGASCGERDLRGRVEDSRDGQTYLAVKELNGSACSVPLVDGAPWSQPLGVPGRILPGEHHIDCGGDIGFAVRPGTTLFFDYWGP